MAKPSLTEFTVDMLRSASAEDLEGMLAELSAMRIELLQAQENVQTELNRRKTLDTVAGMSDEHKKQLHAALSQELGAGSVASEEKTGKAKGK